MKSFIHLHGLELAVKLGWLEPERAQSQPVLVDIKIQFLEPPLGCITDNLSDTHCYDELISTIQAAIVPQEFHLLEYLAHEIYQIVKKTIDEDVLIGVTVAKKPDIAALKGGATFYFGDEKCAW